MLAPAGCVIDGSDQAAFLVDWDLVYVGTKETLACDDAGTPTVTLDMVRKGGPTFHDTFKCNDRRGQSETIPSGAYDVTIALKAADGTVVSANNGTFPVPRRGITDLGIIAFQIQAWEVHWSIARGNATVTCDQSGAKSVRLVTQLPNMAKPLSYLWPCSDGEGISTAVPIGTYSVQVQLEDAAGKVLSATKPMTFVASGAALAALPPITFDLPQ
jgi:hypothetical protein